MIEQEVIDINKLIDVKYEQMHSADYLTYLQLWEELDKLRELKNQK